jgi:hypothetical protein
MVCREPVGKLWRREKSLSPSRNRMLLRLCSQYSSCCMI